LKFLELKENKSAKDQYTHDDKIYENISTISTDHQIKEDISHFITALQEKDALNSSHSNVNL